MAQLTDLEKVRKSRTRRKQIRAVFMLAVFAAVIFSIVFVVDRVGQIDFRTFFSDLGAEFTKGSGYPTALPGGKITELSATDKMLILVSDTNIYTYNATGHQSMNLQHGMSEMGMSVARDRILLFDRGGTRISLLSRAAVINEVNAPFTIYDADLGNDGTFAVVTGCDEYLGLVTVYNRAMKDIFHYYSDKPLMGVAVSGERDAMAVGSITTVNGSFSSLIQRFQFSIDKTMAKRELADELVLKLDYSHGGTIRVITNKRVLLLDEDLKDKNTYEFGERNLKRFFFRKDGGLLLHLEDATGAGKNRLVMLGADFRAEGVFDAPEDIISLAADNRYVYVAQRGKAAIYTAEGDIAAELQVVNLHNIHPMGDTLYYVTGNELCAANVPELIRQEQERRRRAQQAARDSGGSTSVQDSAQVKDSAPRDSGGAIQDSKMESASGQETGGAASSGGAESGVLLPQDNTQTPETGSPASETGSPASETGSSAPESGVPASETGSSPPENFPAQ